MSNRNGKTSYEQWNEDMEPVIGCFAVIVWIPIILFVLLLISAWIGSALGI